MSKFLKLNWKLKRENPSTFKLTKKTLVVNILDSVFMWSSQPTRLKNGDTRLLKKMKNGNASSGELIMAVNHDNPAMKKLVLHYIKSPNDIEWRI